MLSRVKSATSVFKRRFSASSCCNRRISATPSPANVFFQREKVCSEIPVLRHTSPIGVPVSAWRNTNPICSSVYRFFFMAKSPCSFQANFARNITSMLAQFSGRRLRQSTRQSGRVRIGDRSRSSGRIFLNDSDFGCSIARPCLTRLRQDQRTSHGISSISSAIALYEMYESTESCARTVECSDETSGVLKRSCTSHHRMRFRHTMKWQRHPSTRQ